MRSVYVSLGTLLNWTRFLFVSNVAATVFEGGDDLVVDGLLALDEVTTKGTRGTAT